MVPHASLTLDLREGGNMVMDPVAGSCEILYSRTGICVQSLEVNKTC